MTRRLRVIGTIMKVGHGSYRVTVAGQTEVYQSHKEAKEAALLMTKLVLSLTKQRPKLAIVDAVGPDDEGIDV